jgi:hypothetical protein
MLVRVYYIYEKNNASFVQWVVRGVVSFGANANDRTCCYNNNSIANQNDGFISGLGMCGKGHKEWVKNTTGGPHLKMKARLA